MDREFALFEVRAFSELRARIIEIAAVFRGRVIAVSEHTLTIEATGIPDEIDALEELLGDHGLVAVRRSGPLSIGHPHVCTHVV